jgi:hypothetical protein
MTIGHELAQVEHRARARAVRRTAARGFHDRSGPSQRTSGPRVRVRMAERPSSALSTCVRTVRPRRLSRSAVTSTVPIRRFRTSTTAGVARPDARPAPSGDVTPDRLDPSGSGLPQPRGASVPGSKRVHRRGRQPSRVPSAPARSPAQRRSDTKDRRVAWPPPVRAEVVRGDIRPVVKPSRADRHQPRRASSTCPEAPPRPP